MSHVVTSETSQEFYAEKLNLNPTETEQEPAKADEQPEFKAEEQENGKKRKPVQERINELVGERNQAREERDMIAQRTSQLEKELESLRQKIDLAQPVQTEFKDDPKPQRFQFATDEDFLEAMSDWKTDQKLAERQKAEQEERQKKLQEQLVDNWNQRMELAKQSDLADFDEVVGASEINLPQHLYAALLESDLGPQLAYYLAKNPQEAQRLMRLSPVASVRELGKLEATFDKPKGKTPPVEKSSAPEPIQPLKNAIGSANKPPEKMDYNEWKAWRQAKK